MFRYALDDVRHTATLYRNTMAELARHAGIDLQAHRLFSPASVAAAYYEAMGLARPLEQFTNIDPAAFGWQRPARQGMNPTPVSPEILGAAMSAFFGGRAEARLVRTPVPVVVLDAVSMYPTVDANLGTWRVLSAERLESIKSTQDVRELLADPDLFNRCLSAKFWREHIGLTLVEVDEPAAALLPVRARWDRTALDAGLGLNPLTYHGRLWYVLPDVIAATLDGVHLKIQRAVRLEPVGIQAGLRRVRFRGGPEIDPTRDDPFVAMVEERQRVLRDTTLSDEERKRRERALKITNLSAAFGVLARFDRREPADPVELLIHGADPIPISKMSAAPEDPGPYCFPPLAANITAGARLMLMLLERMVIGAGGSYVFCDTDSMAIVASRLGGEIACATENGDSVHALSWDQVRELIPAFDDLNPYDRELVPHLWKVEHQSMDRELTCLAISAKRYAIFDANGGKAAVLDLDQGEATTDERPDDEENLTDWSEHGLGMYLDPTAGPDAKGRRDAQDRREWMREAWDWVIPQYLGEPRAEPPWADAYALTQFSVSSPAVLKWFAARDAELPPLDRMRPGSFGLLAHPVGFLAGLDGNLHPAAPFERNPAAWGSLNWYDRGTGRPIQISNIDPSAHPDRFLADIDRGKVRVKTLSDVLHAHDLRIEHKSLAPDGGPVTRVTTGLLRRRRVESAPSLTRLSGKEGNKLVARATGEVDPSETSEYRADLGNRADMWDELIRPVARLFGAARVADAAGLHRRSVERGLKRRPSDAQVARWAGAVASLARRELAGFGVEPPPDDLACLYRYLSLMSATERSCACGCGRELTGRRSRWASEACRKRAARRDLGPVTW